MAGEPTGFFGPVETGVPLVRGKTNDLNFPAWADGGTVAASMKNPLIPLLFPALFAVATGSVAADTILDIDFEFLQPKIDDPDGLDDADRIQDVSGNGYHGFWGGGSNNVPIVSTETGTAIDNTLKAGKVILRDSLSDIPDGWDGGTPSRTPYFTFDGTLSYTFEALVNWNNTTSAVNGLMGQTTGNELWIREKDGYLNYAFVSGAANANLFSNTISIGTAKADAQWHAVAVVYDGPAKEIRSYLDGTLLHTNTDPDIGSLGTMVNGANDFSVGAYNGTASNYFNGIESRYRISSGALAPEAMLTAPPPPIGADITWTGGTDGNWDLSTTGNWKLDAGGDPALFANNDQVTFDDSAATGAVAIDGMVKPSAITIENDATAYTFSGGTVGGIASLTKRGPGVATLAAEFTNTGAIAVEGGTLVAGNGATEGSPGIGPVTIDADATLKISRSDTLDAAVSGILKSLGGAGTFVLDGGGTLILRQGSGTGFDETAAWSNLTGSVVVRGNSELRSSRNGRTAFGSGALTLGDATTSGALAQYDGSWTWTNNIVLIGPDNAIRNRSSATYARILKLQGAISGDGGLRFEDPSGSMTDNKTGFVLTGDNTLTGTLTIDAGVPVRIGGVPGDENVIENGPAAAGSLGTATVVDNGFLTFSRTDEHTVANAISGDGQILIGLPADTETQVVNLTGAVSNTGQTTVRSGTLLLNGTHGSPDSGTISVLQVDAGATLGGGGATTSDLHLDGTLAPGNGLGTLATSGWAFVEGGAGYSWEIGAWSDAVAGTDTDLFTAEEILLNATSATPATVVISPVSLTGFEETPRTFTVIRAATSISGFDPAAFVIDDAAFKSATGATGTWTIQQTGNDLELVYAAGSGPAGYAAWIAGFEVGGLTAASDDPDHDGVPNAIEFLLGGNPALANDVALPAPYADGDGFTLAFDRDDKAINALDVVVETSTDLLEWLPENEIAIGPEGGPGVSITDNGATDSVVVTIPKSGAARKFARLRATIP